MITMADFGQGADSVAKVQVDTVARLFGHASHRVGLLQHSLVVVPKGGNVKQNHVSGSHACLVVHRDSSVKGLLRLRQALGVLSKSGVSDSNISMCPDPISPDSGLRQGRSRLLRKLEGFAKLSEITK